MKIQRRIIIFLSILAVCASELWCPALPEQMETRHDVNSKFFTLAVGSYSGMVSSVEWVQFVYSFANVAFDQANPKSLPTLAHVVADLDTNWAYPRLVAAWIFPQFPQISESETMWFLEDGAKRFPSDWRFRITWAQYILDSRRMDPRLAKDSAARILLPLSESRAKIPEYVRSLAFTLLNKNGKPNEAMSILLQTYEQIPDPLIRFQFQGKIADLLQRNEVNLGASDSTAVLHAIAGMLDSKDASQIGMAKGLLIRMVQPEEKAGALAEAHQLAEQFKVYQRQAAAGR